MKKIRLILIIFILLIMIGVFLFIYTQTKKETNKSTTKEYECTYRLGENFELNSFSEKHIYDIKIKNDIVTNVSITEKYIYKDYDTYYRYYNLYNITDTEYKILGSDPDAYMLQITKTEEPNISYEEYLKNNKIEEKSCKEKTNIEIGIEKKVNSTDNTYICKHDNLISYITVDSNNLITSVMDGTIHKIDTKEEYDKIKSNLVENDVLKYIYDEDNLSITQLNKMLVTEDLDYDNYIKNSLFGYICELEK